jgi:hypothetical protein
MGGRRHPPQPQPAPVPERGYMLKMNKYFFFEECGVGMHWELEEEGDDDGEELGGDQK